MDAKSGDPDHRSSLVLTQKGVMLAAKENSGSDRHPSGSVAFRDAFALDLLTLQQRKALMIGSSGAERDLRLCGFAEKLIQHDMAKRAGLSPEEVLALRLYTGPMVPPWHFKRVAPR